MIVGLVYGGGGAWEHEYHVTWGSSQEIVYVVNAFILIMVVSKSDYKRLFLQSMLQRRWASETTVKLLFTKCIEATQG